MPEGTAGPFGGRGGCVWSVCSVVRWVPAARLGGPEGGQSRPTPAADGDTGPMGALGRRGKPWLNGEGRTVLLPLELSDGEQRCLWKPKASGLGNGSRLT